MRKWWVPGICPKPEPGTTQMPVASRRERQVLVVGPVGGEGDPRESVHRARDARAMDARYPIEAFCENGGAGAELRHDVVALGDVEGAAGAPFMGRSHHAIGDDLAGQVGTEADRLELGYLVDDLAGDIAYLHVPAAMPALADEALGGGVEGEEGDVRDAHLGHHPREGIEAEVGEVHVLLVHLVGEDGKIVGAGEGR